jgi:hypothetical protein
MEASDFKEIWAQYDKKLSDHLRFNEAVLRKMNLESSKREMQHPLVLEVIGLVVIFLMVLFLTVSSFRVLSEPEFCIPGFLAALIGVVNFVLSAIKVSRMTAIDYHGWPVVRLQKELARLNKLILDFRTIEYILVPFWVILLFPVFLKTLNGINIYREGGMFVVMVLASLAIGLSVGIWLNRHMVDKKMEHARRLLAEVEQFEKEG